MSTETELKLTLSPPALRQARRLRWLRSGESLGSRSHALVSVYFDTPDMALRTHDLTLRVRQDGPRYMQTIKMGGSATAGPLARHEWETEIASGKPDLKGGIAGTPVECLAGDLEGLRPVFRTEVRRVVVPVRVNASIIELAFDEGVIVAGRHREPISEVELELKLGRLADLALLARQIEGAVPLGFGAEAKSDRGYALRLGQTVAAASAKPVELDRSLSASAAFTRIGLAGVQHIASNRRAVEAGDGEGIHQMRVGLRRLRALISFFGPRLTGTETSRVRTELKWLFRQLGRARDLDVLLADAVALREVDAPPPEVALLERDVRLERDSEAAHARRMVRSARYERAILTTVLWLIGGSVSSDRPVRATASRILDKRYRRILADVESLSALDAHGRHRLRISIKKLRHAVEFFAPLYGHRKRQERLGAILEELQDSLGRLQDMHVHATFARRLAHSRKPRSRLPEKVYAMGLMVGRESAEGRTLESKAKKAGRRLKRVAVFW